MASDSRTRLSRVGHALSSTVLALLVLSAALTLACGFLARPGKDGINRFAGHPMLTVLSGSMVPVFKPGDMVIDDPISASQSARLVVGDIVTFHVSGSATELITHRIHALKQTDTGVMYQTKGDANNAPDPELVAPDQIVGTYRGDVPFGGYFLQAVQKKTVSFFLVFLPLLYLVVTSIAKRWKGPVPAAPALEISASSLPSQAVAPADLTVAASTGEYLGGGGRGLT